MSRWKSSNKSSNSDSSSDSENREIQIGNDKFKTKRIKCDECDTKIWTCYRCRHCHSKWCENCVKEEYGCCGPNHYFSEECCEACVPEYGRVVGEGDDKRYYCPECAPPGDEYKMERKFKNDSYRFQSKIMDKYHMARGLGREYLNNASNWKRYNDNPQQIEKEWEEMMTPKNN